MHLLFGALMLCGGLAFVGLILGWAVYRFLRRDIRLPLLVRLDRTVAAADAYRVWT